MRVDKKLIFTTLEILKNKFLVVESSFLMLVSVIRQMGESEADISCQEITIELKDQSHVCFIRESEASLMQLNEWFI